MVENSVSASLRITPKTKCKVDRSVTKNARTNYTKNPTLNNYTENNNFIADHLDDILASTTSDEKFDSVDKIHNYNDVICNTNRSVILNPITSEIESNGIIETCYDKNQNIKTNQKTKSDSHDGVENEISLIRGKCSVKTVFHFSRVNEYDDNNNIETSTEDLISVDMGRQRFTSVTTLHNKKIVDRHIIPDNEIHPSEYSVSRSRNKSNSDNETNDSQQRFTSVTTLHNKKIANRHISPVDDNERTKFSSSWSRNKSSSESESQSFSPSPVSSPLPSLSIENLYENGTFSKLVTSNENIIERSSSPEVKRYQNKPKKPKRSFDRHPIVPRLSCVQGELSSSLHDITELTSDSMARSTSVQCDDEKQMFVSKEDFDHFIECEKNNYSSIVSDESSFLSNLDQSINGYPTSHNARHFTSLCGSSRYLSEKSKFLAEKCIEQPIIDELDNRDIDFRTFDQNTNDTVDCSLNNDSSNVHIHNSTETLCIEKARTIHSKVESVKKFNGNHVCIENNRIEELGNVLDSQIEQLETLLTTTFVDQITNKGDGTLLMKPVDKYEDNSASLDVKALALDGTVVLGIKYADSLEDDNSVISNIKVEGVLAKSNTTVSDTTAAVTLKKDNLIISNVKAEDTLENVYNNDDLRNLQASFHKNELVNVLSYPYDKHVNRPCHDPNRSRGNSIDGFERTMLPDIPGSLFGMKSIRKSLRSVKTQVSKIPGYKITIPLVNKSFRLPSSMKSRKRKAGINKDSCSRNMSDSTSNSVSTLRYRTNYRDAAPARFRNDHRSSKMLGIEYESLKSQLDRQRIEIEEERNRLTELKRQAAEKAELEWMQKKKEHEQREIEEREIESKKEKLEQLKRDQELRAEAELRLIQEETEKMKKHEELLKQREKELAELHKERERREELEKLLKSEKENENLLEKSLNEEKQKFTTLERSFVEEKNKRLEIEKKLQDEELRNRINEEKSKKSDSRSNGAPSMNGTLKRRIPSCTFSLRSGPSSGNSDDFNLLHHIAAAGHVIENSPGVKINRYSCRGYLFKMGKSRLSMATWKRRWFVFDRKLRALCYYQDERKTKSKGILYFQSIQEVFVDASVKRSPYPKTTFCVRTPQRTFVLAATCPIVMSIWIDVIYTGKEGTFMSMTL